MLDKQIKSTSRKDVWGESLFLRFTFRNDMKRGKFCFPFTVPCSLHSTLPRQAFTLAEVLITLGIIGIVAALTIPTLMQNANERANVVAPKKA